MDLVFMVVVVFGPHENHLNFSRNTYSVKSDKIGAFGLVFCPSPDNGNELPALGGSAQEPVSWEVNG